MSTKTTAGKGNPFVSLGELIASVLTTFLSFVKPVLGAILFVLFFAGMVVLWKRLRSRPLRQNSTHDALAPRFLPAPYLTTS